jgi:hypothetical protein
MRQTLSPRHKVILLAVSVVAAVVAVAGCSSARATKPAAHHAASTQAPLAVSSSAPSAETTSQAVQAWFSDGGQSDIDAIVSALGNFSQAAEAEEFSQAGQDCSAITSAIETAESNGPIPYAPAERSWAAGLADFEKSAVYCQIGVATSSVAEIEQANNLMTRGTREINKTTRKLDALNNS